MSQTNLSSKITDELILTVKDLQRRSVLKNLDEISLADIAGPRDRLDLAHRIVFEDTYGSRKVLKDRNKF